MFGGRKNLVSAEAIEFPESPRKRHEGKNQAGKEKKKLTIKLRLAKFASVRGGMLPS